MLVFRGISPCFYDLSKSFFSPYISTGASFAGSIWRHRPYLGFLEITAKRQEFGAFLFLG